MPDDFRLTEEPTFAKFWDDFPKQRAGSKAKALQAYDKAIIQKRANCTAGEIAFVSIPCGIILVVYARVMAWWHHG